MAAPTPCRYGRSMLGGDTPVLLQLEDSNLNPVSPYCGCPYRCTYCCTAAQGPAIAVEEAVEGLRAALPGPAVRCPDLPERLLSNT